MSFDIVHNPAGRLAFTLISSVVLFWYAWRSCGSHRSEFAGAGDLRLQTWLSEISFSRRSLLAIISVPTDLCIALLPLGLLSQYLATGAAIPRWARLLLISCQGLLFLPPMHVILLAWHVYAYAGIPIVIMLLLSARICASTRRQKLVPLGSAYTAKSFPGGLFARSSQLKTDS